MQNDVFVQVLSSFPYPFIYRHDRSIYQTHPHLDPLNLFRNVIIASFCGYFVGKFAKRRELSFAMMFPLPLVGKFVYDEWRESATLRKHGDIDF